MLIKHKAVVALAGATGMVGKACLQALVRKASVASILVLARRSPAIADPKIQNHEVDFSALDVAGPSTPEPLTAALCALGTTIKTAGSQAAFRAVDFNAVLNFARWARGQSCPTFVLVSSAGADPCARSFYLRVKGETEAAVAELGFSRVIFLRPGLLLGSREEARPGEAIARAMMPALGLLLIGSLSRYRGITASAVAEAMVAAALEDASLGVQVWENADMRSRVQT